MAERQTWDPDRYARTARYVADLAASLVDVLAPRPGEAILDLGCGDGALTERLVAAGAAVVGLDASAAQVEAARARGLDARVGDGEALAFEGAFDAVFSNAALHWMTRPDAVIGGVWRALRPGGRFVGELGGAGNVATVHGALRAAVARRGVDPDACEAWYFPAPEDYRARLERAGFRVATLEHFPRPTPLPAGLRGWLANFGEAFLGAVPEAARAEVVAEVEEACRPALLRDDGVWVADYVRLRFCAVRPGE